MEVSNSFNVFPQNTIKMVGEVAVPSQSLNTRDGLVIQWVSGDSPPESLDCKTSSRRPRACDDKRGSKAVLGTVMSFVTATNADFF